MNAKSNIFKSAVGAGALTIALAIPYIAVDKIENKPVAQVIAVNQPLKLEELDLEDGTALIQSGEYAFEVEFNLDSWKDGNGYQAYNSAEVSEIKSVTVFNEDGEVKDPQIDSQDFSTLAQFINSNIPDRV